jgi:multicomponent Na+:H+ antiporter subunit D
VDDDHGDAEGHTPDHSAEGSGIHEAPLLCVLPPVFTAVGCIVLFFFADDIYRLLTGIVP